jgi:AcrR family transcriptional regulator
MKHPRDNKYEKILLVAAKSMSEKGAKATSLQAIADEVGLHKSTFFHYFKNKEELLLRILEKAISEVNTNLENIIQNPKLEPEEKLKRAVDNHLTLLIAYLDNVKIYLNELGSLSKAKQTIYFKKRRKYQDDFEKVIVEMKRKGYFGGLNSKIVTFGVLGMLNWVTKWYKDDGPLTIKDVSDTFYRMMTKR